jgi:hypothetical protein
MGFVCGYEPTEQLMASRAASPGSRVVSKAGEAGVAASHGCGDCPFGHLPTFADEGLVGYIVDGRRIDGEFTGAHHDPEERRERCLWVCNRDAAAGLWDTSDCRKAIT